MTVFEMYVGTLMKSDTAHISGVRFTSGEPVEGRSRIGGENKRCGSVFTAVMDGISRYELGLTHLLAHSTKIIHFSGGENLFLF